MTVSSMRRNSASPSTAKMSAMVRPVVSSIAASVSSSVRFSALASRRPIVDLPDPGNPTSTAFGAISPTPEPAARTARARRPRRRVVVDVGPRLRQRVATELLQGRPRQNQRHHGFDDDTRGRHRAHVGPLMDRDSFVTGGHVDGGQCPRHRRDRLHRRAHPQRLTVGHPAFQTARPIGRAHHAVGAGIHLVVGDGAAAAGCLEAVADLHALDRLDAHDRAGQLAVEAVVTACERAESDGQPVDHHLDDSAERVAVLFGRLDLGDHRGPAPLRRTRAPDSRRWPSDH